MFMLNVGQTERCAEWMKAQDAKVAERQKESDHPDKPYYGCTGGAYSYIFTPTTIGLCVEVRNNLTKETINLTDTEAW
jgi:hypothetical protein